MDALFDSVLGLRRKTSSNHYFVPHHALYKLLDRAQIKDILRPYTQVHELEDTTEVVYRYGRLVFSILISIRHVAYITEFIETEPLQPNQMDRRLPLRNEDLPSAMVEIHAKQFIEKQWEFCAPTFEKFTLRRVFADGTILPFSVNKRIGGGGFGIVYNIEIDADHQQFKHPEQKLVRKEMMERATGFENELENLARLNMLRHPHIIPLLGCYTVGVDEPTNFIFPKAGSGDLHQFIRAPRLSGFTDNNTFLIALAGLASGVAAVHNFVVSEVSLELMGCHHDIKAANVLVDNKKFLLSDFGLSRLKTLDQSSETPYKVRKGFSIAPECQKLGGNVEKGLVRRSSDIWSFGCVILDVVTYMLQDKEGVDAFEERREFEVDNVEYSYYHKGTQAHPAVIDQITALLQEAGEPETLLVRLVEEMLRIPPDERPVAADVANALMRISLFGLAQSITSLLDRLEKTTLNETSVEPWIEAKRFASWVKALDLHDTVSVRTGFKLSFEDFRLLVPSLEALVEELERALVTLGKSRQRVLPPLRHLITSLYQQVPPEIKVSAEAISEVLILQTNRLGEVADWPSLAAKTSLLAHNKHDVRSRAEISPAQKESVEISMPMLLNLQLGCHETGLHVTDTGDKIRVLIEYKHYYDAQQGKLLYSRMTEIANIRKALKESESFGLLSCVGFFHDPSESRYGLVYHYPSLGNTKASHEIMTLFDAFEKTTPSLAYRFKLAYGLATAINSVHSMGWVHKGLRSANVLMPMELEPKSIEATEDSVASPTLPFLAGYNRSRPNKNGSFTDGPSYDPDSELYEHPAYLKMDTKFVVQYDYYSLGMILLELGHWRSIKSMVNLSRLTQSEARTKLVENRVGLLSHLLGDTYRAVVKACLKDPFRKPDSTFATGDHPVCDESAQLEFHEKVLSPLLRLSNLAI